MVRATHKVYRINKPPSWKREILNIVIITAVITSFVFAVL